MQKIINIIFEMVMANFTGMILAWSGAIVDIPTGWYLCDGNNGTPDLRNRFVIGAGDTYSVDDTGGANTHIHSLIGSHTHQLGPGAQIATGANWSNITGDPSKKAETSPASSLSPYYSLAFIMKG